MAIRATGGRAAARASRALVAPRVAPHGVMRSGASRGVSLGPAAGARHLQALSRVWQSSLGSGCAGAAPRAVARCAVTAPGVASGRTPISVHIHMITHRSCAPLLSHMRQRVHPASTENSQIEPRQSTKPTTILRRRHTPRTHAHTHTHVITHQATNEAGAERHKVSTRRASEYTPAEQGPAPKGRPLIIMCPPAPCPRANGRPFPPVARASTHAHKPRTGKAQNLARHPPVIGNRSHPCSSAHPCSSVHGT